VNLTAHRNILITALGDGQTLSPQALRWVITGNLSSDLHQLAYERHFDSAPDRETLAVLWGKGFKSYLDRAVSLSLPSSIGGLSSPRSRRSALHAFGEASHSLTDFYAHTNWVELHAAQGIYDRRAPLIGNQFDIADFPEELESGFYSLRYGIKGCPQEGGVFKPPAGFNYCHETLAKDHPDRAHGADLLRSDGLTCFEAAFQLAVSSTRDLWDVFINRIRAACSSLPGIDPEILLQNLAWGSTPARKG